MKSAYLFIPALIIFLSGCSQKDNTSLINTAASLPESFNFNQMGLKVINSSTNPKKETMSTLYGNDQALAAYKGNGGTQPGEVIALVTWKQQEDDHWFGAKIPGKLLALELIKTKAGQPANHPEIVYQRFEGSKLTLNNDTAGRSKSIAYILSQQPSILP